MYLRDYLKQYEDKRVKLFVDMDGVIADYEFGSAKDFDKKRPMYDSIKKLEIVSKMPNIEMFILSATRYSEGIGQKNWWLDQYAPFFKCDNRIILSREENNMEDSAKLKAQYLRNYRRDGSVLIVIDDDPRNLKMISELNDDVILLKDSVLVDDTIVKFVDINNQLLISLCNFHPDLFWKLKISDEKFILGMNTQQDDFQFVLDMNCWDDVNVSELSSNESYEKENGYPRVKRLHKRK